MSRRLVLSLLALCLLHTHLHGGSSAASLPDTGDYENVALLNGGFELFWTVNGSAETIHMAARAKTKGWLAVGISETLGMVGTDAMVGWVSDGVVYATDRFIFNKSMDASGVALDAQQDWRLLGGHEEVNQTSGDTWTTIHFWRELDTGDCNDRAVAAPGVETFILWAMGDSDEFGFHSDRGFSLVLFIPAPAPPSILAPSAPPSSSSSGAVSRSMGLLSSSANGGGGGGGGGQQAVRLAGSGARQLNFTFVNEKVSTNYTIYMCKTFTPRLPSKVHVIEWGPIINSTNPAVLHHALVYGCSVNDPPEDIPPPGAAYDCLKNLPCNDPIGLWGAGALPFAFPSETGFPIGPGYYTTFVLQMHYTNPEHEEGLIDSSGLYFKVDEPREQDAAMMETGPYVFTLQIKIPPKMPSWTQRTVCPPMCTRAVFPEGGVKIVASALHQHMLGRQMFTDIYRGGEKVFNLSRLDYYDFASQQAIRLNPPFHLMPGDELRTQCVWDSTARTNVTMGGQGSNDEMCIDYIMYYPAPKKPMGSCFDFCAGFDENQTLILDPESPLLSTYYFCGGEVKPGFKKCKISYGENLPLEVYKGCPAEAHTRLTDISHELISLPEGVAAEASAIATGADNSAAKPAATTLLGTHAAAWLAAVALALPMLMLSV